MQTWRKGSRTGHPEPIRECRYVGDLRVQFPAGYRLRLGDWCQLNNPLQQMLVRQLAHSQVATARAWRVSAGGSFQRARHSTQRLASNVPAPGRIEEELCDRALAF